MVDGPFTRSEAAERCRCKPEELCLGPLAGIDESDKIRTIYDGSKGGAIAHILPPCHPLSGTEEKPRDVHQPGQGQSPGAEGPERDPQPVCRAEGPERKGMMETSGRPGRLSVVGTERPGGGRWEPLTWQPPTQGETFIILKADVTKAHRRIKVLPKDWKYQVACIQNRWWVNRVGTYGMASAQLYWGRKASLVLRLLYYIFPQVDWHLVFVDDYCWVLRCSRADWDATAILATLLALKVPLSWKKTALCPGQYLVGICGGPNHALCAAGSSQARHNPGHSQTAGPGGHLHQQGGGTSPGPDSMGYFGLELEEGLHHFGQATEAGSRSGHPFGEALQPEVPTGISICSHTSVDGGLWQTGGPCMGWWLVLGCAQPRQVPCEVVPAQNHAGGRAVGFHYWGPAAGDCGLGALRPPPSGEGCSALCSRLGFSH